MSWFGRRSSGHHVRMTTLDHAPARPPSPLLGDLAQLQQIHGRGVHVTAPLSRNALKDLPTLADRGLNFDPSQREDYLASGSWAVDHRSALVGREARGTPTWDGPFVRARTAIAAYRHVDPSIVRAGWFADAPLLGRDLVIEGRFTFLRFVMGLRVGGVLDREDVIDGRRCTRWGWNYQTLEGHLERGQMDFEVRKYHETGEVLFVLDAWSQRAAIANPLIRFGMFVFGRAMQHRFGRAAERRMVQFGLGQRPLVIESPDA